MEIHSDAKMVDIQIIEVPYTWSGFSAKRELTNSENTSKIKLTHRPTGIVYEVGVKKLVSSYQEAQELRARAKLIFIHELHGRPDLNK